MALAFFPFFRPSFAASAVQVVLESFNIVRLGVSVPTPLYSTVLYCTAGPRSCTLPYCAEGVRSLLRLDVALTLSLSLSLARSRAFTVVSLV